MKKNPGRKERRRQAKHNRTAYSGLKMWANEVATKKINKLLKKYSHADYTRGRDRQCKDRCVIREIDGTSFVV